MPARPRRIRPCLGLQQANLNILNGGVGLAELVGSLGPIYQMVTSMFAPKLNGTAGDEKPANGADISQVLREVEDKALKNDHVVNR